MRQDHIFQDQNSSDRASIQELKWSKLKGRETVVYFVHWDHIEISLAYEIRRSLAPVYLDTFALFFSGVSSYNDPGVPTSYPYWIVCVSGGPAIVIALLHAALWKPLSPILGSVVSSTCTDMSCCYTTLN